MSLGSDRSEIISGLYTDGPILKKKIKITRSDPVFKDGNWFLNIADFATLVK
jgi:hypothetical protein